MMMMIRIVTWVMIDKMMMIRIVTMMMIDKMMTMMSGPMATQVVSTSKSSSGLGRQA